VAYITRGDAQVFSPPEFFPLFSGDLLQSAAEAPKMRRSATRRPVGRMNV